MSEKPPHRQTHSRSPAVTAARKEAVLVALASCGHIGQACKECDVPYSTFKGWTGDEEFAAARDAALQQFHGALVKEAVARGCEGWREPVLHQGQQMYAKDAEGKLILDADFEPIPLTTLKKSDQVLLRLLDSVPGFSRSSGRGSVSVTPGEGDRPTKIVVEFVDPPQDWDAVKWGEDGRAIMPDPLDD